MKPIYLRIKGDHVPSKKNSKMAFRNVVILKPEIKKRIEKINQSLESQLLSIFRTTGNEILTEQLLQSLIAWSLPEDDCWEIVSDLVLKGRLVESGEEGAEIIIERID